MTFDEVLEKLQVVLAYPLLKTGGNPITLGHLLELVAFIVLVILAEKIVWRQLMTRVLRRTRFDPPLQFAIRRIAGYVFIALGLYVALQLVGINLSSLAFLAGAVGVGVGFGLQNIVNNFVSGLIILAERPIAIGDRVEVGGVAGKVAKMSLRSTTVVTNDNISIIVPNADFITHPVTNWSYGDTKVQIRLSVGVAYGSDLDKLRQILIAVAKENPHVMAEPAPSVYFIAFGDSSLDFELGVWTKDMTHSPRRFRSDLFFAIEKKLRENKIEIPFPQRDLHLRSGQLVAPRDVDLKTPRPA